MMTVGAVATNWASSPCHFLISLTVDTEYAASESFEDKQIKEVKTGELKCLWNRVGELSPE